MLVGSLFLRCAQPWCLTSLLFFPVNPRRQALSYNFSLTGSTFISIQQPYFFYMATALRRLYPTVLRAMGVTSEMEEQVPFRLFQVCIRYHSPRQNLLIMESISLSIIRFISRQKQTAAQTKHWKPHFIGCIVFFILTLLPFLRLFYYLYFFVILQCVVYL